MLAAIKSIYQAKVDGWRPALAEISLEMAAASVAIGETRYGDGGYQERCAVHGDGPRDCTAMLHCLADAPADGAVVEFSDANLTSAAQGGRRGGSEGHGLGIVLRRDRCGSLAAAVHRGSGSAAFSPSEVARFATIARHLGAAVRLAPLSGSPGDDGLRAAPPGGVVDEHVLIDHLPQPTFLVDPLVNVIHANESARQLLASGVLHRSPTGALAPTCRGGDRKLAACVAAVGDARQASGHVVVQRPVGYPLTLRVAPYRPATSTRPATALVIVYDPEYHAEIDLAALRSCYSFTQTEAKLVGALLYMCQLAAIAARLNMTYATARTHLARIFQKARVSSQAELVSLILRSGFI